MSTRPEDLKARMAAGMVPQADASAWPTPKAYAADPNQGGYMQQLLANVVQGAAEGATFMPSGIREQFASGTPEKVMPLMQTIALIGAMLAEPGPDVPVGKAAKKGITAFHGSPHNFEKFSTDAIGTGEGAAAYGRGLYFAESPKVAQVYREALAQPDAELLKEYFTPGNIVPSYHGYDKVLDFNMTPDGGFYATVQGVVSKEGKWVPDPHDPRIRVHGTRPGAREVKAVTGKVPGKTYKVELQIDPDEVLDWDVPLKDQPSIVEKLGMQPNDPRISRLTGGELYNQLAGDRAIGNAGASEFLKYKGIPGIRYFDGFSRDAAQQGTRNYVVFDDQMVSILEKYSMAGLIGAGVASGVVASQSQTEKPR